MIDLLSAAAAVHPTLVRSIPEGILGSSITVGNVLQGIGNFLLGGTMIAVLGVARRWHKDRSDGVIEMRRVESAEDSSLRTDLMAMITSRDKRISDLERGVIEERIRCSEEMNEMQKQHNEAVAGLYGEITGLRENMIQQAKSGDVLRLHANAPTAVGKFLSGDTSE